MKILELFSGLESFSKVARANGHEVFTVDNELSFKPSLCIDILELEAKTILKLFGRPDFIWASPPCTTFSVASIYRYWDNGKPKNEKTLHGISLVRKTISLIEELKPRFFLIENPRGMLRKQEFMPKELMRTVTYCQYGAKIQKPTDLWTNLLYFPKPMCKPGASCHEKSPRGSSKGLQGVKNPVWEFNRGRSSKIRSVVPEQLCLEIIKVLEQQKL
jgi:site-specific DNA-cytosine methylase